MGTFRLGAKIGTGGMATVHLAVQEGPGGFEKHVAFKRIKDWVHSDQERIDAFLKEARIAAKLSHPNIVGTLDVGRDETSPYIVMEYLCGESVSFLLSALKKVSSGIPVPVACYVASQVAAALEYAHTARGPDGCIAPIVHRDVSPSNIMVCYNGSVKLLDFGIATRPDLEQTRSGLLKGKISHFAPEQLRGARGDPRSDVFQLGIVLWEMLTGKRLFGGPNDIERMKAVIEREIPPPSALNRAVPVELDAIVLSALDRDPMRRCSAGLLQTHLERTVLVRYPSVGRELQTWMSETFPRRLAYWTELEQEAINSPTLTSPSSVASLAYATATQERPLWLLIAGSSLAATFALTVALLGMLVMYRARPATSEPPQSVGLTALPAAAPAPEADLPGLPRPMPALPAPPELEPPARPEPAPPARPEPARPEPAPTPAKTAAVPPPAVSRPEPAPPDAPPEEAQDVEVAAEPPAGEGGEPPAQPDPYADENDEWRVEERSEIVDPFNAGQ